MLRTSWRILPGCSSESGSSFVPCRRASVRSVESASSVRERHQQPGHPQGVAAEQGQEPRGTGRDERVVAVLHQQPAEVGQALPDQPRQPDVGGVDGDPAPRRRSPGPERRGAVGGEGQPDGERLPRRDGGRPGHAAPLVDVVGGRFERHLHTPVSPRRQARPWPVRSPATEWSSRCWPPRTSAIGARSVARSTYRVSGTSSWAREATSISSTRPAGVSVRRRSSGDLRVVDPAAEPPGDVGVGLPVGAAQVGPDQLQVAAPDRDAQLGEQAYVVHEPPLDAAAAAAGRRGWRARWRGRRRSRRGR